MTHFLIFSVKQGASSSIMVEQAVRQNKLNVSRKVANEVFPLETLSIEQLLTRYRVRLLLRVIKK